MTQNLDPRTLTNDQHLWVGFALSGNPNHHLLETSQEAGNLSEQNLTARLRLETPDDRETAEILPDMLRGKIGVFLKPLAIPQPPVAVVPLHVDLKPTLGKPIALVHMASAVLEAHRRGAYRTAERTEERMPKVAARKRQLQKASGPLGIFYGERTVCGGLSRPQKRDSRGHDLLSL